MMERKFQFKGSHGEIGEQIGGKYKEWGRGIVGIQPWMNDVYDKQLAIYEKHYPEYLDFLKGVAKGLGLDEGKTVKFFITIFLGARLSRGCSAFVVKNQRGVWVGRNYDWREAAEISSSLFGFDLSEGGNSFTAITDMGVWKVGGRIIPGYHVFITEDAWNEHGLYIGLNGAPQVDEINFGMNTPHLVQLVAEKCQDVKQAIGVLKEVPADRPQIFTLADRGGNLAVVEKASHGKTRVIESRDYLVATNHYNHPDFIKHNQQIFDQIPFHSTFGRYHCLSLFLSEHGADIDLDKIGDFMGKAPVLQDWRGMQNGDSVTVWTLALNLPKGQSIVTLGPLTKKPLVYKN